MSYRKGFPELCQSYLALLLHLMFGVMVGMLNVVDGGLACSESNITLCKSESAMACIGIQNRITTKGNSEQNYNKRELTQLLKGKVSSR